MLGINQEFVFNENRARVGRGSGLYSKDASDGKYALLLPLIEVPFIKETLNTVEIKVASSDTISKIEGSRTLEEAEAPVYLHRDVLRVLESVSGKTLHLLSKSSDETGFTFDGSISYTPDSAKMDEAWQGTIKITPLTKPQYVDDVYGLCKPTAKFASGIPANVQLETTTGVETIAFTCDPSDATVTASTSSSGVVTATVENGAVKITGVSAGSAVVALKTAKEGYASWETTIHVVVPQATE